MECIQLETEDDVKEFAKDSQCQNRGYGINFMNVGTTKNTIEFRLANGTLDENTWLYNINLFGGIVKAAKDISIIQNKAENARNDEERKKIEDFEKIKGNELKDEERLELLLDIVVQDEDRDVYRKRYEINSKLIEGNPRIKRSITEKVAKKSVDIKMISKKIFTGEDKVTGKDYEIFEKDLLNKRKDNVKEIE